VTAPDALERLDAEFELISHEKRVESCEEAAEARGMEQSQIVKSLIVERKGETVHALLPGDRQLSESKFGEHRLVDPERSFEITGQESGTVHPFASDLDHVVDFRIFLQDELSFTTGSFTEAVRIAPSELETALESAEFGLEIEDVCVSDTRDYERLSEVLPREHAKFVSDAGREPGLDRLLEDGDPSMVVKLFQELERHGIDPPVEQKREALQRAESENHLQNMVQKLAETGELPESSGFDLESAVGEVLESNPEAVKDLRSGKDSAINFLVGQVMQRTGGRADPSQAREEIEERF
jgi:prolyl-tRNA editing enzyme YbaK/EbsC (Cys-tRNA(Pro) deacylase)